MVEAAGNRQTVEQPQSLVKISNIKKTFGSTELLTGLDFEICKGDRVSILGPGGSGKSTLLKIIMGLVEADEGVVELLGERVSELSRKERQTLMNKVAMAFQLGGLFDFMTVRENILFAMENMTNIGVVRMEEIVVDMLSAVNLPFASNKFPSELSGGMRRRVGIVRAMAIRPELALLDEPTAGLDPVTSSVVIDMIHRIADEIGATCLCVTSCVDVAFTFSSRVALLKDGVVAHMGTWDELHAVKDPWVQHFLDVRDFVPPSHT